jgi:hypothetical protein
MEVRRLRESHFEGDAPQMKRRSFLAGLATLAAGMVIDPERLLWVPGAKKIFVPATPVIVIGSGDVLSFSYTFTIDDGGAQGRPTSESQIIHYGQPATVGTRQFKTVNGISIHSAEAIKEGIFRNGSSVFSARG